MKKELGLVCWTKHILSVIEKAKDRVTVCSCSCWNRFSLDEIAVCRM